MANELRHWIDGRYAYDSRGVVHVQVDQQNQPSAVVRESQYSIDSAASALALAETVQSLMAAPEFGNWRDIQSFLGLT
jgi:hypothetical protein